MDSIIWSSPYKFLPCPRPGQMPFQLFSFTMLHNFLSSAHANDWVKKFETKRISFGAPVWRHRLQHIGSPLAGVYPLDYGLNRRGRSAAPLYCGRADPMGILEKMPEWLSMFNFSGAYGGYNR